MLAIGGDENNIVVNRVLMAAHRPLQSSAGERSRVVDAVINSGFDLRPLFVIIPSDKLQSVQLAGRAVHAIDLVEGLQPGLSALLAHHPSRAPGSKAIVKALVGTAISVLRGVCQAGIVKI